MSTASELHDQATVFAGYAYVARIRGNVEEAKEYARKALPFETQAAEILRDQIDAEPSRSVLYLSAASLAMQCGEYDEAEQLIETGLQGKPPREIAQDLRDVLEQVKTLRQSDRQKQQTA
jgi:tetratricopeptide (TPR) repeat protein